MWSHSKYRNPKSPRAGHKPVVVAGEGYGLALFEEKVHRCQMEGIQRPNRLWKGFQGPREHGRRKLDQGQATEQRTHLIGMRAREFSRVNSSPDLVFDEPTGDQRFAPQSFRRRAVLGQKMRQRHRGIEVDQRSLRSSSSSFCSLRKVVTGLRGGGLVAASAGGVTQPLRTASDNNASAKTGLLVCSGGTISATTRSRSVTSTVSPCSASRTYSLSLFFKTFSPTALIAVMVASSSYLCQAGAERVIG